MLFGPWSRREVWKQLLLESGEGGLLEELEEVSLVSSIVRKHPLAWRDKRRSNEKKAMRTKGNASDEVIGTDDRDSPVHRLSGPVGRLHPEIETRREPAAGDILLRLMALSQLKIGALIAYTVHDTRT